MLVWGTDSTLPAAVRDVRPHTIFCGPTKSGQGLKTLSEDVINLERRASRLSTFSRAWKVGQIVKLQKSHTDHCAAALHPLIVHLNNALGDLLGDVLSLLLAAVEPGLGTTTLVVSNHDKVLAFCIRNARTLTYFRTTVYSTRSGELRGGGGACILEFERPRRIQLRSPDDSCVRSAV